MKSTGAWCFALGLLGCVVGCAPTKKTAATTTPPSTPPPARTKIAVLPVESDLFPKAARALNQALDATTFGAPRLEMLRPKASLEVIQLSIECVEATPSCYAAVGKSLGAEHVVLAQLIGGSKRRDKHVKVALTLFDTRRSEPVEVTAETYVDERAAERGVATLVEKTRAAADRLPGKGGAQ